MVDVEREWRWASPQEFLVVARFRGTRCQCFRLNFLHSNFKWCFASGTLAVWYISSRGIRCQGDTSHLFNFGCGLLREQAN
jgi:hypothetical protein